MVTPQESSAATLEQLAGFLARLAPLGLAESWDNVGLLVGDSSATILRVMTCLTITPAVVDEALEQRVSLVVAHHPLPFQPLGRITADTTSGQMLLRLVSGGVAVYSAHTAFDSAAQGINQRIAERLELQGIAPLQPMSPPPPTEDAATRLPPELGSGQLGSGRYGAVHEKQSLEELAQRVGRCLGASAVRAVGEPRMIPERVGVACGSGGSFLSAARRRGCDALVTGEANFHACLEAEATGVGLILVGHYASERFAMEELAVQLSEQFPGLLVWASRREADPLWTVSLSG